MIGRREFMTRLSGAAAWPLTARAQQANMWRIGVLETTSPALNAANFSAFRQGLRDLAMLRGKTWSSSIAGPTGARAFRELAAELVRLKVDLIVLRGAPAVLAAKGATAASPLSWCRSPTR